MNRRASRQLIGAIAASAAVAAVSISACTVWSSLDVPSDGGTSGDGAVPFDASGLPTFLGLDDAIRLCSVVASCTDLSAALRLSLALPAQNSSFSACVDLFAGPRPPGSAPTDSQRAVLKDVVAAAPSCPAVLAALPVVPAEATNPLCVGADGGVIVGAHCVPSVKEGTNDVVACGDGLIYHCGSSGFGAGASCIASADGTDYDCVVPGNCGTAPACNGSILETCDDGLDHDAGIPIYDCSLFGATCVASVQDCIVGGVSAEGCSGPTTQCTDGVTLQICAAGGFDRLQCDTIGAVCQPDQTYAYCSIQHSACDQSSPSINGCKDTTISLCVGGQLVDYDCAKVGMKCAAENTGTSAACQ